MENESVSLDYFILFWIDSQIMILYHIFINIINKFILILIVYATHYMSHTIIQ